MSSVRDQTVSAFFPARAVAAPVAVLSPAILRQYTDDGFVAIPELCGPSDLAKIRTTLRSLFRRRVGRDEGTQFDMLGLDVDTSEVRQPQIIKPSVAAPELLHTQYFERLFAAARQMLGPDAQFSFDHSILKPAHSAAATPWHQDEAHHRHKYLRYRQVSFWMPLQDTPVEAGCMRYVPGSNHGPLLAHDWLNHDPRIHAVECSADLVDESVAVAMPVAAGSSIAHDGRTLHAAWPNVSAEDRFAYIVVFTAPPVLANETRQFTLASTDTANMQRRARWLLRGGFLIHGFRRLRQGLRSGPRALWLKVCLFARVAGSRARAGK
jgi:ectoine hydroxylase-related dioxygenase (phytanoyl-CoA dioxygenase family)